MSNITLVSHDSTGRIVFSVDGVHYAYSIDYGVFLRLRGRTSYKPGALMNVVKKEGRLIEKDGKPV